MLAGGRNFTNLRKIPTCVGILNSVINQRTYPREIRVLVSNSVLRVTWLVLV